MKYTSPIGRIVQGNPLVGNPQTNDKTNTPKLGKDGNQLVNWYTNVAFEKANPKTGEMIAAIFTEAARLYPALFPYGYQPVARADVQPPIHAGGCIRSDFAIKMTDGDSFDQNGKSHATKEGWAGCWIVKISTYAGAMRVVNGLTGNSQITEIGSGPAHIKTGDYVIAALDISSNGWTGDAQSKPGIYMNPDMIQLVGYGQQIVSGPNPDEILAGAAAAAGSYVPAGMSTTPTASLPMPVQAAGVAGALPGLPPQPQALPPVITAQALPPVAAAAPALPGLPTLPNHAVVANVLAAAPVYQMTAAAAAAGHTREALNALGHTDEVLLANGFMVKVG